MSVYQIIDLLMSDKEMSCMHKGPPDFFRRPFVLLGGRWFQPVSQFWKEFIGRFTDSARDWAE